MPVIARMTLPKTVTHRLRLAYFLLLHSTTLPVQFRERDERASMVRQAQRKEYPMKRAIVRAVVLAVSVGWWLTGAAVGQAVKANSKDQQFVQHAARDGLAEVQLGQMAAERASNPEVQRFGQRMVTDHTKANQELMTLAQSKNIAIPMDID